MKKLIVLLMSCLLIFIKNTNSQTWTNYTEADGLVSNGVYAIAIDVQGNKWFGTGYGVSKFDGTTWTTYNTSNGLTNDIVTDIAIDKQNHIVIGTVSGVSEFDGTIWKTYTTEKDDMPCDFVESIAIDTLNNKWYGTDGCGFLKYDGTTWSNYTWSNDLTQDNPPPPYCEVAAIAIDVQGSIWYSCQACGLIAFDQNIPAYLVKYDGTTWTKYTTSEYLYNAVTAITIDAQGNVWVGTGGGLFKFNGENWTKYTTENGLPNNRIMSLTVDDLGNIWVATRSGIISKFNGTTWTNYYSYPFGLEQLYICDIAIDNQGNIWLGTHGGVVKLSNVSTEISPVNNENHLNLYPNPVQDVLHINLTGKTGAVQVLNMFGECIIQKQIAENENTINVSSLRPGIYFVRLFYDNQIFVSKVIKY